MPEEEHAKDEYLFFHLVTTFTQSAWIALGKIKNPMTDKIEQRLDEASLYIDLLDMVKNRMSGNLSAEEERFLDSSLGGLKLNYMEEMKNAEKIKTEAGTDHESKDEGEGKEKDRAEADEKNKGKEGEGGKD